MLPASVLVLSLNASKLTSGTAVHYEDLPFNNALPPSNVIPTPYKGLTYRSFVGSAFSAGENLAGAPPSSKPNYVSVPVALRTLALPAITPVAGSSFNFRSFTLACVLETATAAVGVKTGCTVRAKGFKAGRVVAAADTKYVAGKLLGPTPFQKQTLPSTFVGLDKVEFDVKADVATATTVILTDDLKYEICK